MKIKEAIALLTSIEAEHGNIDMYFGDMKPLTGEHFDVVTDAEEEDKEKYGAKFFHVGLW